MGAIVSTSSRRSTVSRGAELDALRRAVAVLERYVARHWDQWFNFYDIWEPRP